MIKAIFMCFLVIASLFSIVGYHEFAHKQILELYGSSGNYTYNLFSVGVVENGFKCQLNPDCLKLQAWTEIIGYHLNGVILTIWCAILFYLIGKEI